MFDENDWLFHDNGHDGPWFWNDYNFIFGHTKLSDHFDDKKDDGAELNSTNKLDIIKLC